MGSRYHEPSVPHIYQEASVVHRFHRMLLSLGKDRVSVQLCFGCFAMDDSVPVLFRCTRFVSPTHKEGRGGKEPNLCPADHSAGILHSRLRLTAARGCSCRYVSLSGSLAPPPVISFYDMLLSSPYSNMSLSHICLAAGQHLRKKRRTSFSDSAIAL